MRYICLTILLTLGLICLVQSQTVSGFVFRDFNSNGVFDVTATYKEVGAGGVAVTAYNAANVSVSNTVTDSKGNYNLITGAGFFRVEFTNFTVADFTSFHGSTNNSSVQFVSGGATNVNFGLNYPQNYCETTDPFMFTPCYVNGDALQAGSNSKSDPVLVGFKYSSNVEFPPSMTAVAVDSQIGTTWGIAYQRESNFLFTSAFLKRYSGFGPSGISAIYKVDKKTNTVNTFVKLSDIGINVGVDPHTDLPANKYLPSYDSVAFLLVGKSGIGAIALSDDGKYLFVANLFQKKIHRIFIDNPARTPTAADVVTVSIPLTDCPNGDGYPFALKFYRNDLYVGITSTAETSKNISDLKGLVYRVNTSTGVFTKVLTIPFSYRRGFPDTETPEINSWYPWLSSKDSAQYRISNSYVEHPQPQLSAIEFDVDGSMVVDVMDRIGNLFGNNNYWPSKAQQFSKSTVAGGHILRAQPNGTNWSLESNGTSNGITTAGAGNNKGPGGGIYYYDQELSFHQLLSMGSLSLLPGSGTVVFSAIDATNKTLYSGGFRWMQNLTGQQDHNTLIYNGFNNNIGKASGLGGTTLICAPPPIEIGNRVWKDTNSNGIQDADEPAVVGATVKLYDNNNTLLSTATTDANGNYYFSSVSISALKPNTTYKITVENLGTDPSANNLVLLSVTSGGIAGVNSGTTISNNDAVLVSNIPTIFYTTGNWGENNHTLDFGFVPCPTVSINNAGSSNVCVGANINLSAVFTNLHADCQLQWQSKTVGGNTWTNINGANSASFTTSSNTSLNYRVTFNCANNGCCN